MFQPEGIIVPIATAMHEDESVNGKELRAQVDRQVSGGIHGIFALGTNGECYALTTEEKLEVVRIVVERTAGRVPVYVGTGCISTRETIFMSRKAKELGADALSIVSPYFVAVSQEDIYRHYAAVAEAVDLPIVLYNMPARTGNNIEHATLRRLAKYPNIVGIKDSSGNFDNTIRYIEDTDRRLSVLAGNDSLILWTLLAGGRGAIAGTANVYPEISLEIWRLWKEGRIAEAILEQAKLRPLRDVMKLGNPNSVIKRAMNLLGHPVGPAREPVGGVSPKIDDELRKAFEHYK
jgi:4-hydroxy-tetrahydrodipicolinate synthase